MNDAPSLSERLTASLGTAVYGAPVSFVFWLVVNFVLRNSGGVSMTWVAGGIVAFAVLGFVFPKRIGQVLKLK